VVGVVLDTHAVVRRSDLPTDALRALREMYTHNNPEWASATRAGRWTGPTKKNPKGILRHLFSYREDGPFLLLPRGDVGNLRRFLREHGVPVAFEDRTRRLENARFSLMGKARSYQSNAVKSLVLSARPGCTLKGRPGSGKTVTMLATVAELKQPALVVVHTKRLMRQWTTAAEEWLGVTPGGVGGGGRFVLRSVTIGMQQMLWRIVKEGGARARDLTRSFGCLLIDEAHHAPAESFNLVSECFPAMFRLACTATPRRKDGLEFMLYETFGPMAHEITKEELKAAGVLLPMRLEAVPTSFVDQEYMEVVASGSAASFEWGRMLGRLVADDERNGLVWRHLREDLKKRGSRILVLNERVRACKDWTEFLKTEGVPAGLLIGGDRWMDEQERTIAGMRAGKIRVGVGTMSSNSPAAEGMDLPELTHVYITCPVHNNPQRFEQMGGRAARPSRGKKAGVIKYFWDRGMWPNALDKLKGTCDELVVR
jgi:superfamily II DNA or RNA helicase